MILEFPSQNYDVKWIVTIPAALLSWRLFEAIYAVEDEYKNNQIPGVPAQEQEEPTIIESNTGQDDSVKAGNKTKDGREYSDHAAKRAKERNFDSDKIDNIINNNRKSRKKEIDLNGNVTWRYQDKRGEYGYYK